MTYHPIFCHFSTKNIFSSPLSLKWSKNSTLLASLEEKIVLIDKNGKKQLQKLQEEKKTALEALEIMRKRMEGIDQEIKVLTFSVLMKFRFSFY